MKKLILLSMFITISCSKPESEKTTVDCNCDKVVEKATFNIVGTPEYPAIQYHTVYTTINECTHIQKTKTYDTTNQSLIPQLGQCR